MQKSDIEIVDIPNGTQRVLRFGDKLVQGRMNKDGSLSLDYFKQLMHAFEHIDNVKKVCILGLGAGCLHRYIHKNYPDVQIDTVEILPELVEIAREKFYLPHNNHVYQLLANKYSSHKIVSISIMFINILWLLPIAFLVINHIVEGIIGVMVAYFPLLFLSIYYRFK